MSSQLFSSCPGSSSTPLMLMILVSWFLIWWFCSGLNSLSCAEGTPLCRSEPVPGEAPHLEGRFSCSPHSGLWDNLSHVCMYIVLPFSPSFLLPQPQAYCLDPGCSQTHQIEYPSVPRVAGSDFCSFLWADTEESCQL